MAKQLFSRKSKKTASTEVWCYHNVEDMPDYKLNSLTTNIFASYSGPDHGLAVVHDLELASEQGSGSDMQSTQTLIAGAKSWKVKNRKAYGISMSLYDQHPVSGKISGDPIADSFGLCARENSSIMIVADGVNWGEKSRLAARCATYGCMKFINEQLFAAGSNNCQMKTTHDVFRLLRQSLDVAQATILRHGGGLTTICVAVICPLKSSVQHAVCVISVGDSLAFVLSRRHGMREVTMGSRDVTTERDIRDAGGALGPVRNGCEPELNNLTLSMTIIDPGDIVFLTTDGISDNFDPVVTKIALSSTKKLATPAVKEMKTSTENTSNSSSGKDANICSLTKSTEDKEETGKSSSGVNISQSDMVNSPLQVVTDSLAVDNNDSPDPTEQEEVQKHPVDRKVEKAVSNVQENTSAMPSTVERAVTTTGDAEETCDREEAEQLRLRLEDSDDNQLIMTPTERHWYAVKAMERIIHEFELFAECSCSAQELTGALLQHVLKLTDSKRKVLENPELYRRRKRLDEAERKQRDAEIFERLKRAPGKLDHATIVAYEVGLYHGDEDEDYCQEEDEIEDNDQPVQPIDDEGREINDLGFHDNHFS